MTGLAGPVRDALLTGLIVLVLALPIVGLRLVGLQGVLVIEPHLDNVAELAAAAMLGRFAFRGVRAAWRRLPSIDFSALSGATARFSPYAGWAAVAVAVALPFIGNMRWIDLGTTVLTYVMLGWGLNIVVGLAGLLDLGYVAFYGVGAYTMAILSTGFGFGFWECLPLAGLFAALFGIVLGIPVLRLRGDYLAIVTLGFGEIIRLVLLNWTNLTNGPNGIGGIPAPTLFGIAFTRRAPPGMTSFADLIGVDYTPAQKQVMLYGVILVLALAVNLLALRLRRLPIGRAWEALREDEIACRALGIDPTRVKLSAFALGAMVGGLAGAFFAVHQTFVSPESFTFTESAMILAIVVLGGMGSQLGVALAAVAIAAAPELMRGFDQYRMMLFGAAMVALMVLRPRGLFARRRPSILLQRGAAP